MKILFFSQTPLSLFLKLGVTLQLSEFKSAIISSKDKCIESIKKEPEGSDFNGSICLKWWCW